MVLLATIRTARSRTSGASSACVFPSMTPIFSSNGVSGIHHQAVQGQSVQSRSFCRQTVALAGNDIGSYRRSRNRSNAFSANCPGLGLPNGVHKPVSLSPGPTCSKQLSTCHGLVHPAALLACLGIDFLQCDPRTPSPRHRMAKFGNIHPSGLQLQGKTSRQLCVRFYVSPSLRVRQKTTLRSAFIHADLRPTHTTWFVRLRSPL